MELPMKSKAKIIRELPVSPTGAKQALVTLAGDYYVVSSVHCPGTGPETLVFRANREGEVTDWGEVAGGRCMSRYEAIADLEKAGLNDPEKVIDALRRKGDAR
jgi:hypothetical protein